MASEKLTDLGAAPKTAVVYVGCPRFKTLTAVAIAVSHKSGRLTSPSHVVHYFIDHHLDLIEQMMVRDYTSSSNEVVKQT